MLKVHKYARAEVQSRFFCRLLLVARPCRLPQASITEQNSRRKYSMRDVTRKVSGSTSSDRGRPAGSGLTESINGPLRDECLNAREIVSLDDVRATLRPWRDDYNHRRQHGSLGHVTPSEVSTGQRSGTILSMAATKPVIS